MDAKTLTPQRYAWALLAMLCSYELAVGETMSVAPSMVISFGDPQAVDDNPQRNSAVVTALAMTPNGQRILAAGDDHVVRVFDVLSGQMTQRLAGHTDWIRGLALGADGQTVVTAGADCCCRTWNSQTGEELSVTEPQSQPLRCVEFHPNGVQFAATGFCCPTRVYNLSGGHRSLEIESPQSDHTAVAFSPDGTHLAVGSSDGQLSIWDVTTNEQVQLIAADTRRIRAIAYSPNGQTIATGGDGQTVSLWDPATGQRQSELYAPRQGVLHRIPRQRAGGHCRQRQPRPSVADQRSLARQAARGPHRNDYESFDRFERRTAS